MASSEVSVKALEKTVLILGAGFSKRAGFPLQAEILGRMPQVQLEDWADQLRNEYYRTVGTVGEFLSKAFPVEPTEFAAGQSVDLDGSKLPTLEDVFTLLDSTIARREYSYGLSREQLETTRDDIKTAILFVIHHASQNITAESRDFYQRLAAGVLDRRTKSGVASDPLSVITLNWDTLLDDSIYQCVNRKNLSGKVDVDYCCYTNPIGDESPHTPSLLQKAKGIFNIKILKLHGSTNWLRCPSCNRLFTAIGSSAEAWTQYIKPGYCENCSAVSSSTSKPVLEPFFVTPTFLKVFDNPHIQTIWQNAYVELSEADKVVFVGYSLPDADYYVRTIIRRALRPTTRVVVYLAENDFPKRNTPKYLLHGFASMRYRRFFGETRVEVHSGGVEEFLTDFSPEKNLKKVLRRVADRIKKNSSAN